MLSPLQSLLYTKANLVFTLSTRSLLFHAGTAEKDGAVVTSGGRVLCATALGNSVSEAAEKAYVLADKISWEGMFMRRDIGYRAIAREKSLK